HPPLSHLSLHDALPISGDDGFILQWNNGTSFFGDLFLQSMPGCGSFDGLCQNLDDLDGGTVDGAGTFSSIGSLTFEMSHPLKTLDRKSTRLNSSHGSIS